MTTANPYNVVFIAGPAITHPRNFFGRERELRRLFSLWQGTPLQNAAIIGPKRSGKTSLLMYLKSITITPSAQLRPGQRTDWLPQPERYRWVYVDFQNPVVGCREGLLGYLLDALGLDMPTYTPAPAARPQDLAMLRAALADHFDEQELQTLCFDLGVDYENLPAQGKANKAREIVALFERYGRLGELVRQCRILRPGVACGSEFARPAASDLAEFVKLVGRNLQQPTMILLDEIGVALERCPDLDNAFWEGLRSLSTTYANGNLAFVLAAHEPPAQLAQHSGMGSPFFNIFAYTARLGPLTEPEARGLIASSPLAFAPADVEWILAQSGRWPLLLQVLCRERLTALECGETDDGWQAEGLGQIEPFKHLLGT